jgi:hypothetical protein
MIQLKQLLEELGVAQASTLPQPTEPITPNLTKEQKKRLVDIVGKYNDYAKVVRREGNVSDMAKTLKEISQLTETYVVTECGDFVEANTAKRKIQELKKHVDSFCKLADDVYPKQQQLEALYDDCGKVLEVFFEIHDVVPTTTSVNQADPALKDPRTISK